MGLQLAAECAVLERGEEGVEVGEGGAVGGLELVDGGGAGGEGALEGEGRRRDRDCLHVGDADRVQAGRSLAGSKKVSSASRRAEVLAGESRLDIRRSEAGSNEVVLVHAGGYRAVPQRASTDLVGVPVALDDEEIVLHERRSRDLGLRCTNRLDLCEVESTAEDVRDP